MAETRTPEQVVEDINKGIETIKQDLAKAVKQEDFNALQTKLENLAQENADLQLKETLEDLTEKVSQLKERTEVGGAAKTFSQEFADKKGEIQSLIKGESSSEVVIKADTTRASITGNTTSLHLPDIGQLGVKVRGLYNIFPKIPVSRGDHNGKVSYIDWDESTTVRAAAMVAEGGTFQESTATFREYQELLKKVGDTLPVSEEFGEDAPTAAAELEMFLDTNVETKIDSQMAVGDGVGQNLKGLINQAPAFTAVASGISDANIYDLVKKVRTDITKDRGSKYQPDFVAMNADTIDLLHLKKDSNNNYVFPDKMNIGNIIIVEDNNIPDNELVVGDRRFGRIYEMGGVTISRGLKSDQFVEDMETIKARKRLLFLIRNVDATGFRKVTDVSSALATLAL